jgi:hypothetical protein
MSIIFAFDPPTAGETAVLVRFIRDGVLVHERKVNAVFTDGVFDEHATEDRVDQVAAGVKHKLEVGAVSVPDFSNSAMPAPPIDKDATAAEKKAAKDAAKEMELNAQAMAAERLAAIGKAEQRAAAREARLAGDGSEPAV